MYDVKGKTPIENAFVVSRHIMLLIIYMEGQGSATKNNAALRTHPEEEKLLRTEITTRVGPIVL